MLTMDGYNKGVIMKKLICLCLLILFLISVSACGNNMTIDGKRYNTYGLLDRDEKKDPNIEYQLIVGNLILGCVFFETIIAPIYFFGYSLWEPVGKKIKEKEEVI